MFSIIAKTAGILGFIFVTGCAHQVALTRHISDSEARAVIASSRTRAVQFSSSIPNHYEYRDPARVLRFRINHSFESQLKDLFAQKYPNRTGLEEVVDVHLNSVAMDARFEQKDAQEVPVKRDIYRAIARMNFSVTVGGQVKNFSVSKEADTVMLAGDKDSAAAERTQKAAIEGMITNAILSINHYLD